MGAVTVLGDHHGQVIVIPQVTHLIAQAGGVDLPIPVGVLDIGIAGQSVAARLHGEHHLALDAVLIQQIILLFCVMRRILCNVAAVAVDGDEIDFGALHQFCIAGLHSDVDVVLFPVVLDKVAVLAVNIGIDPELLGELLGVHSSDLILGAAGLRVDGHAAGHRADLAARHHLMAGVDSLGMAQVHDMVDLPLILEPVVTAFADAQPVAIANLHILLVQRQPVFDPVAEVLKADAAVVLESFHGVAAFPAAQLIHPDRQVVVIQGNDGGDVVGHQLIDQIIVERDAFGVHLAVCMRDDAGPAERETIAGETALCHQGHIFLVVMIVIRRIGVIRKRLLGLGVQVDDGRHRRLRLPPARQRWKRPT